MKRPVRLTAVMTHPVQYMSPWFRHIASCRPDLDLTVLYGAIPDRRQQGVGFDQSFAWDIPLTEGYRFEVCGEAAGQSFDSGRFRGIDVRDIDRRLAGTRPDVVLVPGWHSIMQVRALRACRRLGVPVLYRGDTTLFSGPRGPLRPLWALRTRLKLRRFDGYLSVGTHAHSYLRAFGVPEPLIARSPHAVDNDRFGAEAARLRDGDGRRAARLALGASERDFVVLFAGKFTARKRPLDAVRAVATLGGRAVLMMAGDGPLRQACQAEAARLGVRLAWTGFLNQTELPSAFAAADCAIVPSAWESWGLIVNEALASGLPCVVTDTVASAADLVVEGETGHAVPAGDVDAMGVWLQAIRERGEAGHDFGPRCRERAGTCSFAAAAEGLSVLCRRVLSRRVDMASGTRVVACCGAMVSVYGMERSTFDLLAGLREGGAAIHCMVNSWGSSAIVDRAVAAGAGWTPGGYRVPLKWRGASLPEWLRLAWEVAFVSAVLLREAHRARATHVLVPDLGAALYNLPALALLRVLGTTVVVRLGNAPEDRALFRFLWGRLIDPVVTQFVANSRFTAGALAASGIAAGKVRIIRMSPPPRKGSGHGDAVRHPGRIIYVGQLIPQKGCDRLLEAVAALVRRGIDASLDVVGDVGRWEPDGWKGYAARLQARAQQSDLRGRVRFLGEREDVPALLASAAVHCFPSTIGIREGFGIVTVEAKAAGTPSVVTPSGALPEQVAHGEDGYVCADDSADALAEGLEFFLSQPDRLAEAGRRARASAGRFSRDQLMADWLDVFRMARPDARAAAAPVAVAQSHVD